VWSVVKLCLRAPYNCDRFYILKPNIFEIESCMVLESIVSIQLADIRGRGVSHMSSASIIGVKYISIGQLHSMPIGFKIETTL